MPQNSVSYFTILANNTTSVTRWHWRMFEFCHCSVNVNCNGLLSWFLTETQAWLKHKCHTLSSCDYLAMCTLINPATPTYMTADQLVNHLPNTIAGGFPSASKNLLGSKLFQTTKICRMQISWLLITVVSCLFLATMNHHSVSRQQAKCNSSISVFELFVLRMCIGLLYHVIYRLPQSMEVCWVIIHKNGISKIHL